MRRPFKNPFSEYIRDASKVRLFDIGSSMQAAAKAVTGNMELAGATYLYRGSFEDVEWLMSSCKEWADYVVEFSNAKK